jgi:hypothetical protein
MAPDLEVQDLFAVTLKEGFRATHRGTLAEHFGPVVALGRLGA